MEQENSNKILEKLHGTYTVALIQFIFIELFIQLTLHTPFILLLVLVFIYVSMLMFLLKRSPRAYLLLIIYNVTTLIRIMILATTHNTNVVIILDIPLMILIAVFTYIYGLGYAISRKIKADVHQQPVSDEIIKPTALIDHHIKKQNVALLYLLITITGGIYTPMWFLQRIEAINTLSSGEKLNKNVFIYIFIVACLNIVLNIISFIIGIILGIKGYPLPTNEMSPFYGFGLLLSIFTIVNQIVLMVQCLKVRRIFYEYFNNELHREISFSQAGTIVFQTLYLQYKINRI
jgi:uncharacterized membrane protein